MGQRISTTRTRDGVRVAYAESGDGPPLVLVGGWISHLELSWALPAERAFYEAVGNDRTLIRYDKLGCGLSDDVEPSAYAWEHEKEALEAVLGTLDSGPVDLLGISLGTAVAVEWAAAHPAEVGRLVLYGGWAHGPEVATPEIQHHMRGLVAEHWGLASDLLADVFAPDADAATRAAFVTYQRESSSSELASAMLALAYGVDIRDALPHVAAPTLVLHRDKDRAAPVEQARLLADGIPGARFAVVPGRSHLPYIGDSGPLVQAIRAFLGLPVRGEVMEAPRLTSRQREVAALVAEGCTNREIGLRLGITERSAETHLERIRYRLDFHSRSQVAAWYVATLQEWPK
jgi:pimeloyl-ACP methyl ester carboxylesterase/DNA-binding CsgD family transcriptional regulator